MPKKKILVHSGPNGEVLVEAIGFKGQGCKEETKWIEDALGACTDVEHKAEWWARNGRVVLKAKKRGVDTEKLCG